MRGIRGRIPSTMPKASPSFSGFDFRQHLSEAECAVLANPQRWEWIATCLPPLPKPLESHPQQPFIFNPETNHAPPQRELFLQLSGESVTRLGDTIYRLRPGSIQLCNHYEMHGLDPIPGEHSLRQLWLHLLTREQMSSNLFSVNAESTPSDMSLRVQSDPFVQLLYDAWSACEADPSDLLLRTFLQTTITTALMEVVGRPLLIPTVELEKSVIDYITAYIEEHLGEPLTLTRLSKLAGYSPHAFHRLFKRHRQITLHRYIVARRITKGRQLLQQGRTVESIAEEIGLSSAAVFSRFFKAHLDYSPSQWRELNRYEIN